jgi:hypothetical protein
VISCLNSWRFAAYATRSSVLNLLWVAGTLEARGRAPMHEVPTGSQPTQHSWIRTPLARAVLTTLLVAATLTALLAHEAPTLLPTARDRLFPPVPTSTAVPTPSVADVLHARPLRLPLLAPGSPCPTVPGRTLDPAVVDVVGDGPVYVAFGIEDTLSYAPAKNFSSQEWGGQKTIWAIPPGFTGLVLVRGHQVDGPNELRFGRGDVPDAELLFHAPGPATSDPPNGPPTGWTYEIDYTRVRAPGCYAYQIDGETFSDVVIFRAVPLVA